MRLLSTKTNLYDIIKHDNQRPKCQNGILLKIVSGNIVIDQIWELIGNQINLSLITLGDLISGVEDRGAL